MEKPFSVRDRDAAWALDHTYRGHRLQCGVGGTLSTELQKAGVVGMKRVVTCIDVPQKLFLCRGLLLVLSSGRLRRLHGLLSLGCGQACLCGALSGGAHTAAKLFFLVWMFSGTVCREVSAAAFCAEASTANRCSLGSSCGGCKPGPFCGFRSRNSCAIFSGRGAAIAVPGSVVSVAAFRATKSTLASDAFVLSVTFAAFWVFST